jgi:hypothetical protein
MATTTGNFRTPQEAGISPLYHYQGYNREHLIDLLTQKRVYCARPGQLNDPWDCRPWFDAASLDDPDNLRRYFDWVHSYTPQKPPDALREAYEAKLTSDPKARADAVDQFSRNVREQFEDRRIYCLTPYPDSTLMWSHYANDHKGICLEFGTDNPLIATAREVDYQGVYPVWIPHEMGPDELRQTIFTKAKDWIYETEFRILGIPTAPGSPMQLDGDFLTLPEGSLKSIILGCESPQSEIEAIVVEFAPTLLVRRAIRAFNAYRLFITN